MNETSSIPCNGLIALKVEVQIVCPGRSISQYHNVADQTLIAYHIQVQRSSFNSICRKVLVAMHVPTVAHNDMVTQSTKQGPLGNECISTVDVFPSSDNRHGSRQIFPLSHILCTFEAKDDDLRACCVFQSQNCGFPSLNTLHGPEKSSLYQITCISECPAFLRKESGQMCATSTLMGSTTFIRRHFLLSRSYHCFYSMFLKHILSLL